MTAQAATLQTVPAQRPTVLSTLTPIGPLDKTQSLNLAISLPLRNQAALAQFLKQLSDPSSPNYHHYLTPAQFTAKYGPTQADYQALIAFAQANGLTVTAQYPNRAILDVQGSVPAVEKALHVSMLKYQHPTQNRNFFAPNADPKLNLSVQILGISGLDNFSPPQPRYKLLAKNAVNAAAASAKNTTAPDRGSPTSSPNVGSGADGGYMGSDFRTAYVPGVSLTGSGQTVGLLQFDGYTTSDITYYESLAGLPNVPLTNVLLDGFDGTPTGDGGEVEVSLDIEMSMSMAPGLAGIIVYEAGPSGNWHDILNRMANDNLAKQLSCSWYIPGGTKDTTADQIFEQMAAQGQSFYTASGDYDAFTGLIPFPGDTPYATEVGGTMLTTSSAGGAYTSEQAWNRDNGIGTGGGVSTQYAIPSWQQGISMTANLGSTTMRNVPDVALTAENVYVRADGVDQLVGGTSCAAPLWAGFTALVNQQAMVNSGTTVGFVNPAIYAIGQGSGYAADFHDTTVGNNFSSSSPTKFPAVTGYDLCTGWGSPKGAALINALAPPANPVISNTNPLPPTSAGVAYSETLTATGGTPGYTYSIISGGLPGGLTLSTAGVISGTTSSTTGTTFTVQVTDSKGKFSSTALSIVCLPSGTPVITNSSPLPLGSTAAVYGQTFASAGGASPYTYALASGSLPSGLTLTSAGVLSGTPTTVGTYSFSIEVTDRLGANSTEPFSVTVGSPPVFSTGATLPYGTLNVAYFEPIGASGGSVPYTWSIVGGSLPTGLTMNAGGVISGTPTVANTYNFTLKVAGANGLFSTQAFSLAVEPYGPLDHFAWSAIGSSQTAGTPFAAKITAEDATNNTVTNFTGTVSLTSGGTQTILNSPSPGASGNNGTWTLGYSFTPSSTITVTGVRSYSGSKVSIWSSTGTLLASTVVSGANGTWVTTPITPLQLQAGSTYVVSFLSGGQTYYWSTNLPTSFPNGTINQDYYSSGDGFPTTSDSERWWFVDLQYTVGGQVPISPATTPAFTGGVWNGSVTANGAATGVVLQASDGAGHFGDSNAFNVTTAADIAVSPATGFNPVGGTGGPFTPTSTTYQVMNAGTGSMSWTATGAPSWLTVSPSSGTLGSGASTTVTVSTNAATNSLGIGTYSGSISFNNTTSGFGNTSIPVSLTVTPPPPVISSPLSASCNVNQSFSYQITATNSPTSFGATGLPPGLNVTSGGLISGSPTSSGVYDVTLSATNVNGVGTATLVLSILQAPSFTSLPVSAPIAIGTSYSFTVTASGTPAPTFSLTNGSLPPGLTLSSSGVLSGSATTLGTYSGTITATNSVGTASQNFTLTVVSGLQIGINLPTTVNEDDPDGQGTINLSAVSGGAVTVTLTSSNTGALTVPATITVPANQTSVALPYTIIDNLAVYGTQTTTVTASAAGWTGATQVVTVTDNKNSSNWKMLGNGQAHTGVYRGSLLGINYGQAWSATVGTSNGINQAVIDKGIVYVTSNAYFTTGYLTALNASSGAQLWQTPFADADSVGPPAIYKGSVYLQNVTGSEQGFLWSINAATGAANWSASFSTQWANFFAPIAYQTAGIWIGGSFNGGMYGFNFSGSQTAFISGPQNDDWTPSYYNGTIYSWVASGTSGTLSAVNPATGSVLWSLTAPATNYVYATNCAAPIADNLAFLNGASALTAANLTTHAIAWTITGNFVGTPAAANKLVYVITGSRVQAFNENTGAAVTTYQTNDTGITGQPIIASDALVVSSSTATYLFNLSTGALVQTIPYGGPVSATNGALYIAGSNGILHAFQSTGPVAPTITSANSAIFSTGQAGSFQVTATGYPAPTFSAAGLPSWASLDQATGIISGTPPSTSGSPLSITLTASNGVAPNATQNFSLTVVQTNAPVITNGPPPATTTIGASYSFTWTATGYPLPTFSLTAGSLPPGLALSSSGALTGMPTTPGIYSGTVTASNGIGSPASQDFTITVQQAPTITSTPVSMPLSLNQPFSFSYTATGTPAPTYSVTNGSLPPGLTLSSSGTISGTPNQLGTFTGTITATNPAGSTSQNFSLTVVSGLALGIVLPTPVNEGDPDGSGTIQLSAVSSTPTTVTLTSSNTGALTVPASVVVPAGQLSAPLPYTIIDNLNVYGAQTTTVTASASGWLGNSQQVTVTDNKTTDNWSTYGNGQAHLGIYRGPLLGVSYNLAWAVPIPDGSYTNVGVNQVAVAKGLIYATTYAYPYNTTMTVLNAANGSVAWSHVFPTAYSINPPTVYKGNVYVERCDNGGDTNLWSFNAANGTLNWSAPFGSQWEQYLAPTVYQTVGIWMEGGTYGGLYGFNFDGSQKSFTSEPQTDEWTPAYSNGMIYSWVAPGASSPGTFSAVNPANGTVAWSVSLPCGSFSSNGMNCTVSIDGNLAFVNTFSNITAINLTTHATAWTNAGVCVGTPAVSNGYVYAISGGGVTGSGVKIINETTGATLTTLQTSDTGLSGQPVVATDSLIVSSSTAAYLFNLSTGTLVQTFPYGGPVSVANGVIYLAGTDGFLRAMTPGAPVAPTITSANNTVFTVGLPGNFQVTATGFPAPTFSATGLPSWASLNATTGVISGTPSNQTGAPFSITITANNGVSPNATQNFTLNVQPTSYPPTVTSEPPPVTATVGIPYSYACTAVGFPAPVFSVTSGALPPGLNISSGGVISGTPNTPGVFTGTISASNGVGFASSQNFAITVQPALSPPSISNGPAPAAIVGVSYNFPYAATGVPAPTFSSGTLPSGLTLSSGGLLSGMPTTAGAYPVSITASNGVSPTDTQNFTFMVMNTLSGWESKYFTSQQLNDPTVSGQNADPGHDGVPNLLKYLFDINPSVTIGITDRAALPKVGITTINSVTYLTLTFRENPLAGGLTINVQTSPDLTSGWTTVTPDLDQTVGMDSTTGDPIIQMGVKISGGTKEFIRLNVTSP